MDSAQEIKSRLDVVDIVTEYLQLKPAGSGSFKANCPFHQEKTPSFYVNRPRQSWHCFGCNEGGDLISFVMRMEGMEFVDALTHLAQKAGIELPTYDAGARSEKKRLYEVNDLAARFFRTQLLTSPNAEVARAYVAKRGIDDLTGDLWKIGYAPESWDALTKALTANGTTTDELLKAGLVLKNEERGSIFDRFRGRLMFTIWDVHGNVVGFTARLLDPNAKEAKYINTPETLAYKKSHVLYGLHHAKGDIKRQDLAVITEGNMDVVSSHQFGITNVVASSGTALTTEQLTLLKRFTTNLAIAFDADNAGNAATIRGLDLARLQSFNIKIITLPPEAGKDPDEAVRKNPELWKQAIHDAQPVVEWLYHNAFRNRDISKPEEKKLVAQDLLPEFRRIADAVERDAWLVRLAKDLSVSEDALREAIKMVKTSVVPAEAGTRTGNPDSRLHGNDTRDKAAKPREEELRDRLAAILLLKPELRPLAETLLPTYDLAVPADDGKIDYLTVFADKEFPDQSVPVLQPELEQTAKLLHDLIQTKRRTELEEQMRMAELAQDPARIQELLAEYQRLSHS